MSYLSSHTGEFQSYMDRNGRTDCKLTPEKILQLIFYWAAQRSVKHSKEMLDVSKRILIDWFNHCCKVSDVETQINGQAPDVVIQIDETLLRGKRRVNIGRLLGVDENTPREGIDCEEINQNGRLVSGRNHGRRITGPWIFGLLECHRQVDRNYKSGEPRLFIVEQRDKESLLPIIRRNFARGSMI
ncbi:hypothetical protein RF11_13079 [Thelohanellus kitauei]|uniref:ISXO2-like transposase domain-containing protein n=1 Tax=Thelohanellus kitauei TaxID=669202 RepID=A0A0C2JKD3_THEKT|nr:hypothetical protein RF11_13079 [Thelohanellus kitauei]